MKHLIVKHIGPLDQIDIELKKVNVIIGPQSSGKSCVLKLACYCTWVEKRIELTQKTRVFPKRKCIYQRIGPLPQTKRLYQTRHIRGI